LNYKKQHIETLIVACQRNDQKAQMELYQRYNKKLFYSAYRIVKNTEDALDAVQEGFITAFQKLGQYQASGSFEGWLHKIVVRKSIHYYQKNNRYSHDDALENQLELSESPLETEDRGWNLEAGQLDDALSQLNERYQLILKLYYLEGFDHEEISEITQWSAANCRTTLSRAREQLKKYLK